jgi:ABC-type methionine transport system ATPase subunit
MIVERRVRLTYPESLLNQPLIHGLIRQFDLLTNILEAHVDAQGGYLTVTVRGEEVKVQQGLAWIAEQGVRVEVLSQKPEPAEFR